MRKFLESIAPVNKAGKMSKPLLVIQGRNDTRVSFSESEQVVAAVRKNGTKVWYVLAMAEGHGFGSLRTIHFLLSLKAVFVTTLLNRSL
jgi:dipeptidyl aminopeptidase/acylaminoacyl peptidase